MKTIPTFRQNSGHSGKILLYLFIGFFVYLFTGLFTFPSVYAETCSSPTSGDNLSSLSDKMRKCQEAWDQMEVAKRPHVEALKKMESDIAIYQSRIKTLELDIVNKAGAIAEGEKELGGYMSLAERRVRQFYIRSYATNPFATMLSSESLGSLLRTLGYQEAVTREDKRIITQTAVSVRGLEDRKKELERDRANLAFIKEETDRRAASVRKLVGEATAYQTKLSGIIAGLTAQQQSILAQKLAGLNIPRSALSLRACVDDRPIDPGFSPRFAFFTFGVPNRIGLNQWGAKGRADAGQGYDQILRAYYNFDAYQNVDTNIRINVNNGNNINDGSIIWSGSLEDYIKRIYEVPGDWPIEALRAQAVAARSYALAATGNGSGSICANEQCQVFQTNAKGGSWEQAVTDTSGKVMIQGGQPIKAWFSSTHGGYVFASGDLQGWSSTSWTKRAIDANGSINGFSDLFNNAYDRGSPWFYCDWGSRAEYNKTAWLKPDELADIMNVILIARKDSSLREHLYQPDKPNPENKETWDAGRIRSEMSSRGLTPYSSVSDVSIDWDKGSGMTTRVNVSGDGGSNNFDGSEFKDFFNLRAPSNIQIVGPLFNIEKK